MMEPPTTPPCSKSIERPGLFTSKLRIIIIFGGKVKLRFGIGMSQIDWQTASMLYPCSAEIGIIGAFLQRVSFINSFICL